MLSQDDQEVGEAVQAQWAAVAGATEVQHDIAPMFRSAEAGVEMGEDELRGVARKLLASDKALDAVKRKAEECAWSCVCA